jgi:hypothetical protein
MYLVKQTAVLVLLFSSIVAMSQTNCKSPTYGCARTDTNVTNLPSPLPSWGGLRGAGTVFDDPEFNAAYPPYYVRITDASTGPHHDSFSVGSGNGDDSHFSIDDSKIWLVNNGNQLFVFTFDPSTLTSSLLSVVSTTYCCNGQWSQVNANYLYTFTNAGTQLTKLDFGNMTGGQPAATLLYDFANCGVSGTVQAFAGVGGNDDVFVATFGAQDTSADVYVAAYKVSASACYLYRTDQGKVYSYPGATLIGTTAPSANTFYMHGAHLADRSGVWVTVTESQNSCPSCTSLYYAWQIATTTLRYCSVSCEGHATGLRSGWLNNDGYTGHYPSLLFRSWNRFDGSTLTEENTGGAAAFNPTLDTHPTTQNDPSGANAYPVFADTVDTATTFSTYSNEIIAWQQPGPVLRFGHTFSSPADTNFQASIAVGAVSSSGRFYAVTTNGEGTLGNTDGVHPTCTLSAGTCRSDVFILKLEPAVVTCSY